MVFKLWNWMNDHKNNADAHHVKYTDAEVDAIVASHTAVSDAHHIKYTDIEAVNAVEGESRIDLTGQLSVNGGYLPGATYALATNGHANITRVGGDVVVLYVRNQNSIPNNSLVGSFVFRYANADGSSPQTIAEVSSKKISHQTGQIKVRLKRAGSWVNEFLITPLLAGVLEYDLNGGIVKNLKNHTHSALSGTKKLIEININGTPYYFEIYPTKA